MEEGKSPNAVGSTVAVKMKVFHLLELLNVPFTRILPWTVRLRGVVRDVGISEDLLDIPNYIQLTLALDQSK